MSKNINFLPLRTWQKEAFEKFKTKDNKDFLVVATPGSGKTTFGLHIAKYLLNILRINKIIIVVPTEHLKFQWAESAKKFDINLDANFSNQFGSSIFNSDGEVLTYAQIANHPAKHASRVQIKNTLVIFDEIHHGGDNLRWGDALNEAFEFATERLLLTGTPFRSDNNKIPFVSYKQESKDIHVSNPDYTYGYSEALKDKVVRPIIFLAYSGSAILENNAGKVLEISMGDKINKKQSNLLWKNALSVEGDWIRQVFKAAHSRLLQHRATFMPDAGGLVLASNQEDAKQYAKILDSITNQKTTVVVSEDINASEKISKFSESNDLWIIAVKMISEGVDIPRLSVGVYATSTSTSLFFSQAIGRLVRARNNSEIASIFLPSVPELLELASDIEKQRSHIIGPKKEEEILQGLLELEGDSEEKIKNKNDNLFFNSNATLDKVIYEGSSIGLDKLSEEMDFDDFDFGIPGLLNQSQISELIAKKRIKPNKESDINAKKNSIENNIDKKKELRMVLNNLVSLESSKSGKSHSVIHNELKRKFNGKSIKDASTEELKLRIKSLKGIKR